MSIERDKTFLFRWNVFHFNIDESRQHIAYIEQRLLATQIKVLRANDSDVQVKCYDLVASFRKYEILSIKPL